MEAWQELLLAEERGRQSGNGSRPSRSPRGHRLETGVDPQTKFVDLDSRVVDYYEAVIDDLGAGIVHTLNVKSASSAFGLSILIDDNNELRRSYTDLRNDSDELCGMSAYLKGKYYIISVSDLKFRNKIRVGPYNTEGGKLTYEKIQGKYEVA